MKYLITLTFIVIPWAFCLSQEMPDNQSFDIISNGLETINLHNLKGDVEVIGTDTKTIQVKIKRRLEARSQAQLKDARAQFYFDTLTRGTDVYFIMRSPFHVFEIEADGYGYYNSRNDRNDFFREKVNYRFDITLEFPKAMNLNVSSHHDGLRISSVEGELRAKSHHKDLIAEGVGGNATLKTHHGDIEASFTNNPTAQCNFKTHHGDIRIAYQDEFSADVTLKSHHGEFFTEFDWEAKPMAVVKEESSGIGTKYKVGDGTTVAIGGGGPLQQFSTWHGDIYLFKN